MSWLGEKKVFVEGDDIVRWMEIKNGVFSVKSMYKALESRSSIPFPMKTIWSTCVQPKLCFFASEATWGKFLTLDQLYKIGFVLANRCFLCQECEETVNHLLLHCAKTRELWELLFALFGIS